MSRTIQILGTGCARCQKLADEAEKAARAMGIDYRIEKVTDLQKIMTFGVMQTPALAVDGVVKAVGRVPDVQSIQQMLR